jgi:hypothetical protein
LATCQGAIWQIALQVAETMIEADRCNSPGLPQTFMSHFLGKIVSPYYQNQADDRSE